MGENGKALLKKEFVNNVKSPSLAMVEKKDIQQLRKGNKLRLGVKKKKEKKIIQQELQLTQGGK